MQVSFKLPNFQCDETMRPHLERVFAGEYDIPLEGGHKTIADVGANFGAFSIWALHRWPGSVVMAYEPNPVVFPLLTDNLSNYSAVLRYYALGEPGERNLYTGKYNLGEASLYGRGPAQKIEVASPLEIPEDTDILKIDTEGAEVEILEPLIEAKRSFEAVLVEYHGLVNRDAVINLLRPDYTLHSSSVHDSYLGIGLLKYLRKVK